MRFGLFWKLFLLQMVAAAALLGGALAITREHSVRRFGEFVELHDREQVRELASELAKAYAQTPDLVKAAETVPLLWRRLHAPRLDGPPPHESFELRERPPDEPPPGERGVRIVHMRGEPMLPLQLLDAGGEHVLGPREPVGPDGPREPVRVDGKVIGYIARAPLIRPPEQLLFARQQARYMVEMAPIALLVAAAFAALITVLIVRPIRRLSGGAAALARREFGTRLREDRRDELGQLAVDFNRLAAALEGYDTRQRQWLSDVAHELRTPLAVLRGEIEATLDGVRTAGTDTMRSLRHEVGRLEALINDLQLVSLAESGGLRLNLVEADVGALAQRTAERFRERLKVRGLELKVAVEGELLAQADTQRLEQVLANLLENAAHHATAPGPVTVAARLDGAQVQASVADAGPGVADEALPRLFDRLYRVDSARTRAAGGAGLGLSICKSIVEAHGGTIAARRSAAGGLEIVIRLPR
jgi:two-component system sensor histidine kinase BaeS